MTKTRKYWGWGYEGKQISSPTLSKTIQFLCQSLGVGSEKIKRPLALDEIAVRAPRIEVNEQLAGLCSYSKFDRLSHSYGKSYNDVIRGLYGVFPNPPDYVAFPETEDQLLALMDYADQQRVALVPYGGGTSVVGGVEPTKGQHYRGCISVDMRRFNRLLEIDPISLCARFQAGVYGPDLETQLKPHGFTLRHFPQSFEFSTLGGWIATRAGGHYATLYTHIDDLVESVRMVTPKGKSETRRLPASGAGPSEERLILGSEGIFGFITEAWLRIQDVPKYKRSVAIRFKRYGQAVNATRVIAQAGLYPSNCRLVDPFEAFAMGLGNGSHSVLLLAFESAQVAVDEKLNSAMEIAREFGGEWRKEKSQANETEMDVETWKASFIEAPYLRDELAQLGILAETFETAITWDKFDTFHKKMMNELRTTIIEQCGKGMLTCRFTHVYPDGPAPYFTVVAKVELGRELEQWAAIKAKANQIIYESGATITHHHAVGKDHRDTYQKQLSPFMSQALSAIKSDLDPSHVLNPGVLIPEQY